MIEEISKEVFDDHHREIEVNVDSVKGLEKMVVQAIEDAEISTDNVSGLEDYVNNMLDKVVHNMDDTLGLSIEEKLAEFNFENSDGFETAVCSAIAARLTK
jgi:hypothetical protein